MNGFIAFLAVIAGVTLYLAPSIIGWLRHVRDIGSVMVINIAFGWTFVGWFIALAMALKTAKVPPSSPVQMQ